MPPLVSQRPHSLGYSFKRFAERKFCLCSRISCELTQAQNLIPLLCIRPMRLFLSAGSVRRVRIMLLRATHLPFVMMILAYESTRRHLHRPTIRLPPVSTARHHGTFGGEPSVSRCQDPLHSSITETRPMDPNLRQISVDLHDSREPSLARAEKAQLAEILSAVDQLREQVERVKTGLSARERS